MQQLANQLFQKTIKRWVLFWRDVPPHHDLLEKLFLDPDLNKADEKVLLTWMPALKIMVEKWLQEHERQNLAGVS